MATDITQDCTTNLDNTGVVRFNIVTAVTSVGAGDLPFADIFVHSIPVPTDPKSDVFLRVATIVDLTTLTRGRNAAVATNKSTYLVAFFSSSYADVTVATQAKKIIQQRIDDLIASYILYTTQFTTPSDFVLPLADANLVTAATGAYLAAKADKIAKESALASANASLVVATAAATQAGTGLTAGIQAALTCQQNGSLLVTGASGESTFRSAVAALNTTLASFATAATTYEAAHSGGGPGPWSVADAAKSVFDTALAIAQANLVALASALTAEQVGGKAPLDAFVTAYTTDCSGKQGAVTTLTSAKAAADGAAATAQTNQSFAQAAATTAANAADTALAALLAVCPSYVP